MNDTTPFPSGFPLYEFPELTNEVLFAFHQGISKFIYLNAAFEKMWDMPRESMTSNFSLLINTIHPDDLEHVTNALTNIKTERLRQEIEFRIVLPGLQLKWIKLKAYSSQKADNDIITGIAIDITADRDYSETLHKFSDKKNSILAMLSHDLLGSLGNIEMSIMELVQDDKIKDSESAMELVDLISRNNKRSVEMIRDLLNDEFLRSSEAALVKQRVDLIEKVRTIVDQYQQSQRSSLHRFNLVSFSETLFINIDESKFMQVINNLISNAVKFTSNEGTIEVSITESGDTNVLIKVQDNGIGIPAAMQPFLFDKFTKARRRGIHGEPTTGLGMSIIKTIVEWHNGRIWFESEEGKGTTFFVEIPKEG